MVVERRRVLTLCSRASTTQGWRSLVPSSPQTRFFSFTIIYNLPVYVKSSLTVFWIVIKQPLQQIADQTMAELSPIMQDSMKEEEDIVLYRFQPNSTHEMSKVLYRKFSNEAIICSVTVWLVPARPVKRTAWSTWSWRRAVLRWTLQIPVTRGKINGTFQWKRTWIWYTRKLKKLTIVSASRDVTYVFESSQQKPILAPISGTMQSLHPRSLDFFCFSRPKFLEIISLSFFSVITSSGTFIWERLSTAVLRAFLAPTARKCSLARATWQNMLEPYMKGRRGSTKRCHLILQINNRSPTTSHRWTVNIAARLLGASGVWTFTYPRRMPT